MNCVQLWLNFIRPRYVECHFPSGIFMLEKICFTSCLCVYVYGNWVIKNAFQTRYSIWWSSWENAFKCVPCTSSTFATIFFIWLKLDIKLHSHSYMWRGIESFEKKLVSLLSHKSWNAKVRMFIFINAHNSHQNICSSNDNKEGRKTLRYKKGNLWLKFFLQAES